MGATGFGLCIFLLVHMAGNLFILVGPEAFNTYGNKIVTNELLYFAEVGLVVLFLTHILQALILSFKNRAARPVGYEMLPSGDKHTTPVSRTLMAQGVIILVFVVLHLATFKYGAHYSVTYKGEEMRDLYRLVLEVFHKPGYVIWYVFALIVLSFHLGHGFYSSLQTMGLNHPKYTPTLKALGYGYDIIVTAGFIILPLYVYLRG
jgi:succinate dehydrogenase / fumarate reductase cytochrome b subunit